MVLTLLLACALMLNGARAEEPADLAENYRRPPSEWPAFIVDDGVQAEDIARLPALPPVAWHTPESEELGKLLFFDPRLSGSGQLACVSCHDSQLGWGDGRRVAAGHDRRAGRRNAMTLLNAAYFDRLFWDGRADGLLDLALQPIQSPLEMNADLLAVVARLEDTDGYPAAFNEAFGSPEITAERIARAIASFVRSLVSSPSRFDRFVQGDYRRLNEQEIKWPASFPHPRAMHELPQRSALLRRAVSSHGLELPMEGGSRILGGTTLPGTPKTAGSSERRRYATYGTQDPGCTTGCSTISRASCACITSASRSAHGRGPAHPNFLR